MIARCDCCGVRLYESVGLSPPTPKVDDTYTSDGQYDHEELSDMLPGGMRGSPGVRGTPWV